jgi:hypothetical protein
MSSLTINCCGTQDPNQISTWEHQWSTIDAFGFIPPEHEQSESVTLFFSSINTLQTQQSHLNNTWHGARMGGSKKCKLQFFFTSLFVVTKLWLKAYLI